MPRRKPPERRQSTYKNPVVIPAEVYWWPKHGHFWSAKGDRKSKEFEMFWLDRHGEFPVFKGFARRGEFQ